MSSVSSVSGSGTPRPAPTNPNGQLGKDDFLKLMVAQLKHQDPLDPVADKEFMGQMAQFSTLEQITNLAASMDGLRGVGELQGGVGLIGRTLTYERLDGTTGTGVASKVTVAGGTMSITVGDIEIHPATVRSVS